MLETKEVGRGKYFAVLLLELVVVLYVKTGIYRLLHGALEHNWVLGVIILWSQSHLQRLVLISIILFFQKLFLIAKTEKGRNDQIRSAQQF